MTRRGAILAEGSLSAAPRRTARRFDSTASEFERVATTLRRLGRADWGTMVDHLAALALVPVREQVGRLVPVAAATARRPLMLFPRPLPLWRAVAILGHRP